MLLGSDVSAALLDKVEGKENLYWADLNGIEAVAYKPGEESGNIKGRVVATFTPGADAENKKPNKSGRISCLVAPYGVELYKTDVLELFPAASYISCLYEKSCGAVVFMRRDSKRQYLLIENRRHNWGFPKGHIELGETETQTAAREIFEETGLSPEFIGGFRQTVSYYVKDSVRKTAVYFLAETASDKVSIPAGEISSYKLMDLKNALGQLTYRSERMLLLHAENFLESKDL